MVVLLAGSLSLPLREKNALLTSAGFANMYGHSSIDEADMKQARHALEVMRLTLHPRGLRQYLQNWEDLALYFIESLESELSLNPYNSHARQLLDEVRDYPGMPVAPMLPETFRPYCTERRVGAVFLYCHFDLWHTPGRDIAGT